MTAVRVGFAGGNSLLDRAIQKISGGDYADVTHAFIFLFSSIAEAEGVKEYFDPYPGFWLHPSNKYQDSLHVKVLEIDLPDILAAESEARKLLGTPYSYHGCLEAAAELVGFDLPTDGDQTVMCSEAITRILRAGGLPVCPVYKADMVTPVMLWEDLVKYRGGVECNI